MAIDTIREEQKKPKKLQPTRSKLRFTHPIIGYVMIIACLGYVYLYDAIDVMGNFMRTPIIWILIIGELCRFFLNSKVFHIDSQLEKVDNVLPSTLRRNYPPNNNGNNNPSNNRHINRFVPKTLLGAAFVLGVSTVIASIACILFGAPVFLQHRETVTLSLVLVILSIFPFVLYLGPNGTVKYFLYENFELLHKNQAGYLAMIHYNAVFTLMGAWVSSVAAPLDWDRPWQAYPIPNMYGALIGYFLGNAYTMAMAILKVLVGKYPWLVEAGRFVNMSKFELMNLSVRHYDKWH